MSASGSGMRFQLVRAGFALLLALPWVPGLTRGLPGLSPVGELLDSWFAFHCERDPARMLPGLVVCARCYGIYLGLGLGALIQRPRIAPFAQRVWIGVGALTLLLDVLSEKFGLRPPFAPLRLLTGALFAYPASLGVMLMLGRGRES